MLNRTAPFVGLSSEFWAIIGSATAIGALVLTVSGWHRGDIQGLRAEMGGVEASLSGEIRAVDAKLSAEIRAVDAKLSAEIRAVDAKLSGEIQAVDAKLSSKIDKLEEGQARIDARLGVVESHVLGVSGLDG